MENAATAHRSAPEGRFVPRDPRPRTAGASGAFEKGGVGATRLHVRARGKTGKRHLRVLGSAFPFLHNLGQGRRALRPRPHPSCGKQPPPSER